MEKRASFANIINKNSYSAAPSIGSFRKILTLYVRTYNMFLISSIDHDDGPSTQVQVVCNVHGVCTWPQTTYQCLGMLQFTWPTVIPATITCEK